MKAAETDLAPSERLFVQVGLRVRIRPGESPLRTRDPPLRGMFRLRASGPQRSQRPARPDAIVAPMHVEIVYLIGLSDGKGRPMTLRAISRT
jgi:hypothetical protein